MSVAFSRMTRKNLVLLVGLVYLTLFVAFDFLQFGTAGRRPV